MRRAAEAVRGRKRARGLGAAVALAGLVLGGCGGGSPAARTGTASAARTASAATPTHSEPAAPRITPARCGAAAGANCKAHTGRVLAIQSVDPDGDGDLHVIVSGGSLSAPGVTVFDVERTVRPARDPRPGDTVTGAGPVYRGSFHQRQIQVTTLRVARAGR